MNWGDGVSFLSRRAVVEGDGSFVISLLVPPDPALSGLCVQLTAQVESPRGEPPPDAVGWFLFDYP